MQKKILIEKHIVTHKSWNLLSFSETVLRNSHGFSIRPINRKHALTLGWEITCKLKNNTPKISIYLNLICRTQSMVFFQWAAELSELNWAKEVHWWQGLGGVPAKIKELLFELFVGFRNYTKLNSQCRFFAEIFK